MANGINKIYNIMQHSGTDTISELLSLTVNSISPLILTDGDKLILTKNFLYFDSYIDQSKIKVGDKFIATTYNSGQSYYIYDILSSNQIIDKYMQEINALKTEINSLKQRVTALENR